MEEAVERAASGMVPLMIFLGVVAGVLIALAVLLRLRVLRDRHAAGGARATLGARRGPAQAAAGDSVSVLGRPYRVAARRELSLDRGGVHFLELEGPARLVLDLEGGRAMCLPDPVEPPAGEGFPERLERPEGAYVRQGRTAEEGDGLRLALYAGPQERFLLLELRAGGRAAFRGKAVPGEGVLLVERD
ncbi:MAG TPA: hypothetical protein PK668_01755 [Myxococcota bacterium]|nr:hypothetical protein [Myxococcota bacterium]HRY94707.1 hypothetical protein [Myxococcota bacterium]HSA21303.1 hypothetical protein [Myxococcota bacterium]